METFDALIQSFNSQFPSQSFLGTSWQVKSALAIFLLCLICGSVGGLVVGNRMAFFSDALAHCAFAGVALGILICILGNVADEQLRQWITIVMVAFGIIVGVLIAWVRDHTGLASDTVIGVFFALAVGLGAVVSKLIAARRRFFDVGSFIFGDPVNVQAFDIFALAILLLVTVAFLIRYYNEMILTSVHPSLAMSRRVPVVALRYALIVLLALIVNLCLQTVGVLLINGLLIVPAAAAANLTRNMRQHFWLTLGVTLGCGILGQLICWECNANFDTELGMGGVIVSLTCVCFFLSMAARPILRRRAVA